ncbi:MAG: S41 family peptidase [Pseudomonadota bacterium]
MGGRHTGASPAHRRGALFGALMLLAACAGPREAVRTDALPAEATQFFSSAYDQIAEKYLQPVPLAALAGSGLGRISRLDPKLEVRRHEDRFEARADGTLLAAFDVPQTDHAQSWAETTVAVIESLRAHSAAIGEASMEALYQTVIDGALTRLDTYSRYAGRETARDSRAAREGFGGIGITIDTENGDIRVATVIPDSPAAHADLRIDDRIVEIETEPTTGMPARDVVRRLRGPIGQSVRMAIHRQGQDHLQLTLTRALIVPPTVTYRGDGDVAYIRVAGFNQHTTDRLTAAIKRARREIGPALKGTVLDLRGNLGGLLDQAISVADLFLAEGPIVSTRGRHPASPQGSRARSGDIGENLPLVVLINGSSASASEIVAAALLDNGRAVVIGTTSFGKGSVQTVVSLPNEGELVLTWARFHAPSGYSLQDLGVLPSICTSGGNEDAGTILEAVRRGRITSAATMAEWRSADHSDPARLKALRALCMPEPAERASDLELARGLLADGPLYAWALRSAQLAAQPR